ncbi:hypothetical protein MM221_20125 [Salipaludibacillus sp. LMS25]|jgi:hypothetical protein|uniref:hypothetical protein n=1 Tax=Salipaludibacillus sp. LMS25 TaxID=2924031 RepID=UPI0020D01D26|nr:hypothetical protein [Salipaludibacillus sp. LMS25]UTR14822.1 hypothetical protein MM221_20125 [Salipaludibacillus sp. LMS25]
MKEKKVKLGLGIGALAIVVIAGILVYSLLSSPEAKLANAFQEMMEEEVIQQDSQFSMSIEVDESFDNLGLTAEDEEAAEFLLDILNNIKGTSSIVMDKEKSIVEMSAALGVVGDIQGEEIDFQIPFSFYTDEANDKMAIDLDPYVEFLPSLVDTFAYDIVPNVPQAEDSVSMITSGENVSDLIANDFDEYVMPFVKETFTNKKLVSDYKNEAYNEEDLNDVHRFVVEELFNYLDEHSKEDVISQDGNWVTVKMDNNLLVDSLVHVLNKVHKDEEIADKFENVVGESTDSFITYLEDLNDFLDEQDMTVQIKSRYLIEKDRIVKSEDDILINAQIEETNLKVNLDITNEYSYGDDVEFTFYNAEREELTEADMENIAFELQSVIETYMMENIDFGYDEEVVEHEPTQEEQEFYEALENQELTHEDLGLTEEDMYSMVLDCELSGFVAEGTSDLYYPED